MNGVGVVINALVSVAVCDQSAQETGLLGASRPLLASTYSWYLIPDIYCF